MQSDLPQPEADALEHSARLAAVIRERIEAAGGWISFASYMDMALYEPGLGYYSAGARKLGTDGDFVTAPEISPLFSYCLAGQCAAVLQELGGGVILEPGAGSGAMAADMLAELQRLDALPDEYLILEPSADLRARQQATLTQRVPELAGRVRWLDGPPAELVCGVIVANEVADALPVERFRRAGDDTHELGVTMIDGRLADAPRPAPETLVAAVADLPASEFWEDGYTSEVCLRLPAWVASLSDWLAEGAVLLFDYGFAESEYYRPERIEGTLRCYYRHRAHDDPYLWPGLQDLTAWVDFTALARAADDAGFEVAGYTTQAAFLLAAGLDERVMALGELSAEDQARLAHGLRQLVLPGEMGETVKVMALVKGDVAVPEAMTGRDMRPML